MREHFQSKVPGIYSFVDCPLLIVNGRKDTQVRPEDAEKISKTARGPVEWHVVEISDTHSKKGSGQALTSPLQEVVQETSGARDHGTRCKMAS